MAERPGPAPSREQLFERFDVVTEVVGWDERSLFLQQDFRRGDTLVASAVIRARFLGRDGSRVTSRQVLELAGHVVAPREAPAWVTAWAAATEIRSRAPVPTVATGGTVPGAGVAAVVG